MLVVMSAVGNGHGLVVARAGVLHVHIQRMRILAEVDACAFRRHILQ